MCVCVCVFAPNSRKLYTYVRSEDDLNICEFLCSPGLVLFPAENCWLVECWERNRRWLHELGFSLLLSGRRFPWRFDNTVFYFLKNLQLHYKYPANIVSNHRGGAPLETFICPDNRHIYCRLGNLIAFHRSLATCYFQDWFQVDIDYFQSPERPSPKLCIIYHIF